MLSYRLIEDVFGNSGYPLLLFTPSQPAPRLAFLATVTDVALFSFFSFFPWDAAICCKLSCGPEEAIFINDSVDLAWIALCLLLNKKGGPALCFICHRCFSLARQCSIVSMKISGSMQRRALYYYVPAKFRSLFSFFCLQKTHNLLSTMRQATKLHCCSANRLVLVDGLTRCEVCLSAEAAEGSLGTRFPLQAQRKRKNKREQEETRETEGKNSKRLFLSRHTPPPLFGRGKVWLARERALKLLSSDCLFLSAWLITSCKPPF